MKYFAILMALCLLLGGCAAQPMDTTPSTAPTQQTEPSVPETTEPVLPQTPPPTGTNSTEPPPAIGPEGLPTPAL